MFPTQIVVTGELDRASHIWVKGLSDHLGKEDFRKMLDERSRMTEKEDRELADSVLEVSISANKEIVDELIGDESMYEILMEIMEPQIKLREKAVLKEGMKEGMKKGMKKGIQGAVDLLRDLGQEDDSIKESIMKKYNLTGEEAEEYIYTNV